MNKHRKQAFWGAAFILAGVTSIQTTSALVYPLFGPFSPGEVSAWRFLFGTMFLLIIARPKIRSWSREQWRWVIIVGVTTALMNQFFYQSISRIPLGGAVALEYLGPFAVALWGHRKPRQLLYVLAAGLGVLALTRPGSGLTALGITYASLAAFMYAIYVLVTHKMGNLIQGIEGLAMSMGVATVVTSPFLFHSWARMSHAGPLFWRLVFVAFLAIAMGFSFELQGIKRVRPATAGILFALDPAMAFTAGLLFAHQLVSGWDLLGCAFVVAAGIGATVDAARSAPVLPQ